MTNLLSRLSIRAQLTTLVLAIMVPVLALMSALLVTNLQNTREAARQTVRLLATSTAADLQRDLGESETVLARLAARPMARALNPDFCGRSLAEYVDLHPQFVTLGLRDQQANVVCSFLRNPPAASVFTNADWFRNGLRAGKFAATDAMIGPASGRWVSILSYPVQDDAGAVHGLLVLPVDLQKLGEQRLGTVPTSAIVAVLDRSGAVMMRSANAQAFIGKRGDPRAEEATRGMREGFTSNTSLDGVTRLWAFVTVPGLEWRVVAGLPEGEIYAPYYAELRRSLGLAAAILLLATLLAWRIAIAIVRPISGLADAAARIVAGDGAARAGTGGPREIAAVAHQFNQMFDTRDRNESALRQSEHNLSITLQSIGDAVMATDAAGMVTRMNPAAERLTGWPLADALGQALTEVFRIINAESRLPVANPVDLVMQHGKVVGLANHTALLARGGGEYQIADSAAPIHDPAGMIVGVVLVFSDVTEQYRVAKELRQSEERFRSSFDASGVGMAINALDGRWVQVNQALCDIVGYGAAELMALTFQEITHPDDLAQDLANMQLMVSGATRSFQMEKRYRHRDGHTVWINLSVALVRDAAGAPLHTVAHMQDITRRKMLEQELGRSEQRYRRIVQTAEEGIWTIDAQALTTYVNPKMAAMLGYTEAEMQGRVLTDFMDDEGQAIAQQNLERRRQGITEQHDFKFRRKDGSAQWSLVATNPILDADGAYAGALAMITDITARKAAEDALRSSLREKEALLREVHHRVKNNLQVVQSLLRLESGRSRNLAAKSVLQDMQGRIKSMALLHESLYRSHSFAAVDLGAYLQQLSTQVMRAAATRPGNVRLEHDLAPVQLPLDQAAPCGLLVNELISNALKHAFPQDLGGTIRIELHTIQGGPRLRLRVSDTGIGLPADFDTRRSQSLGLQLVGDLAGQLGGELIIGPLPLAAFTLEFTPSGPGTADSTA